MKEILKTIYDACADKKAGNMHILDISNLTVIADCFVLANGSNKNQLQAMADFVQEKVALTHKMNPLRIEGYSSANWILIDYGDVVIHLFDEESRFFYNLDRIWSDAKDITGDFE